ncbi:MAG: methyl-accepting chemotaxis protein [Proteobacteria bacterium]|nr:methyl-accepting chemotaxis protein [Pseudomonadota bacterium]
MFKDLKIGKKLMAGFGAVLGIMTVVGVVALLALSNSSTGFVGYREMARDANLAGQLEADMLMVRMNVKDFIITGNEKDIEEYNRYKKLMAGLLETAQKDIQDPERAKKVDLVEEHIKEYEVAFEKLIVMKEQRNIHVNDTLNVIGPKMEKSLSKIMISANRDRDIDAAFHAGVALRDILLARLYVTKFLDTNDQKDADRVAYEFGQFEKNIAILDEKLQNPERRALLQEILELEDQYSPTFNKLTQLIFERNELITSQLDRLGPVIAQDIEDVKLDIRNIQDTLGPRLVASNSRNTIVILVVVFLAIVLGVFLAIFLTKGITEPLAKGVEFAKIVEQGDLKADIEVYQKDEVGMLVNAMKNMVANLQTMVNLAEQIADGDLTVKVEARSDNDSLAHALQTMITNLSNIVSEIGSASSQVATGSQQLAATSQSISQGATEQASSLEEISSSMSEIESQTKQNADNAKLANQYVAEVRNSAEKGNTQMGEMVEAMNEIGESSKSISKIIKVIDEIAFQTNLLALNAAVEAARAGQHGKGFAVVAEEVRNLAVRSADAAKETSDLIEGAVLKAEAGSEISRKTEAALAEIVSSVVKVSDLVGEISSASVEQATGVSEVTKGLEQIDQITVQNSSHSEESAAAAEELAGQATLLQKSVSSLKIDSYMESKIEQKVQIQTEPEETYKPRLPQPFNKAGEDKPKEADALPEALPQKQLERKTITLDDSEFGKYS